MSASEMPSSPQKTPQHEWLEAVASVRGASELRYAAIACVSNRRIARALEETGAGRIRVATSGSELRRVGAEVDVLTVLIVVGDLDELTGPEIIRSCGRRSVAPPVVTLGLTSRPEALPDLRHVRSVGPLHSLEALTAEALRHEARGRRRREIERRAASALTRQSRVRGLAAWYVLLLSHGILLSTAARMLEHDLDKNTYRLLSKTLLPAAGVTSLDGLLARIARTLREEHLGELQPPSAHAEAR